VYLLKDYEYKFVAKLLLPKVVVEAFLSKLMLCKLVIVAIECNQPPLAASRLFAELDDPTTVSPLCSSVQLN